MSELNEVVTRLSELSRKRAEPLFSGIEWPEEVDWNAWYTSPDFISIYGTPQYEALDLAQRRRLAFYEAVNFFSLNIHGERSLMTGLSARLYRSSTQSYSEYLQHFLDEENKHTAYFSRFCLKYCGKIYPDRHFALDHEYAEGEEDLLFFAMVMIFEEIASHYNLHMGRDTDLHPTPRAIHWMHYVDEARHLVFGRKLIERLLEMHWPGWSDEVRGRVQQRVAYYLKTMWAEYYNPSVYRDAGIPRAYDVAMLALESPICREHRVRASQRCIDFLSMHQLISEGFAV